MLDLRLIRSEPGAVRSALERRGAGDAALVDELLELDARWREATAAAETARAEQKAATPKGKPDESQLAAMKQTAARVKELTAAAATAEQRLQDVLRRLPNLPDPTAADADTVIRQVGDATKTGRDHLELAGERIDTERGARLSGARFAYLRGDLARLEFALVSWALDKLADNGFEAVIPPVLVREQALYGTGFLPDTEQQIYRLADDDLYLVGTSEVALASMHAGEIVEGLPLRYAGFSSCFRREAGAAGKDTRGIFRVHQFDKVEMFAFVDPSESQAEHERILAIEEEILCDLHIPYRVVNIAVDDLGASAAKKYDCEAWLPGQGAYRELTSCSNTTDFQARRLDIRHRPGASGRPEIVHTLNGTAVAVGRTLVALLENGQRDDGSVSLPPVLAGYGAPAELPPA